MALNIRQSLNTSNVLCVIMGGGQGTRLFPLTKERSKPAVPLAGKYRLVRLIGQGGMGEVYEAENTWTTRRVAAKVLRGEYARDTELVERFLREARAATRIAHPTIVEVLDMGQ